MITRVLSATFAKLVELVKQNILSYLVSPFHSLPEDRRCPLQFVFEPPPSPVVVDDDVFVRARVGCVGSGTRDDRGDSPSLWELESSFEVLVSKLCGMLRTTQLGQRNKELVKGGGVRTAKNDIV